MKEKITCALLEKIKKGERLSQEDYEKIAKIAKNEIKFLVRNNIPLTPINYFLWFDIFCYLFENGLDISDPEILGFFKDRYPDDKVIESAILNFNKEDKEFLKSLAEEVEKEIDNSIKFVDFHNEKIKTHEVEFKKAVRYIPKGNVKDVVVSLSVILEELKEQNGILRKKLEESKSEIGKLSKKLEDYEKKALIDFVAELASKSNFEVALKDLIKDYEERNYPFAVILVKIDNIDKLVERYGKEIFKFLLEKIGKKLKKLLRANDVVSYYDDAVFAVIVPGVTFGHAIRVSERIKDSIKNAVLDFNGEQIKATVSVGVAVVRKGMSDVDLVSKTFEALELAEKEGGDCVKTDLDVELGK